MTFSPGSGNTFAKSYNNLKCLIKNPPGQVEEEEGSQSEEDRMCASKHKLICRTLKKNKRLKFQHRKFFPYKEAKQTHDAQLDLAETPPSKDEQSDFSSLIQNMQDTISNTPEDDKDLIQKPRKAPSLDEEKSTEK